MINALRIAGKEIKNFMNEKVKNCMEVLSSAQNRLTAGSVMVGIGIGLIASVYVRPPKE